MKLSFRALKDWVDFQGSPEELADVLSSLGFPNDGVVTIGKGLDQVRVAKILTKKPHPNADRLSLLTVTLGSDERPIVCGARNMNEGDYVALAPVGATIPGKDGSGMTMKEAKIRGETSMGMCCSAAELQLSEEADGIIILTGKVKDEDLGRPVSEVLDLSDSILEIDITPNRPDCLSIRGLARELAAKLQLKLKLPSLIKWKNPSGAANPSIQNMADASAFAACLVTGVSVKATPEKWVSFLEKCGTRSISNLVDVTNIVMFELGHPLHFFDAEKVDPQSIQVRRAKEGERLELLNRQTIDLHPEDLVIADKSGPLSLAGVMGGQASAISDSTKSVLIEVACFNPALIRATCKRHGLLSESSHRFERGLTPNRIDEVIEHALALIKEVSGFESASGTKVSDRLALKTTQWNRSKVESKLGSLSLTDDQIFEWLRRLDYGFESKGQNPTVTFPWYRVDGECLEDVMEDIARLIGYDQLATKVLEAKESIISVRDLRPNFREQTQFVEKFRSFGFSEVLHMSFASPDREASYSMDVGDIVALKNPIQSERPSLRRMILPQLLDRARENLNAGEENIRLVEVGPVFTKNAKSSFDESPVSEIYHGAALWLVRPTDEKRLWKLKSDSYFEWKGMLESLGLTGEALEKPKSYLHPKRNSGSPFGYGGEIHPRVLQAAEIPYRCFGGEWVIDPVKKISKFVEGARFPAVDLDCSLLVNEALTAREIMNSVHQKPVPLLESIRLYDVYASKELGAGKKSLTFSMSYRTPDRTLTMEEARKAHEDLVARLKIAFPEITLR